MYSPEDEIEFHNGERLYLGVTLIDEGGIKEHMERYEFAKKYIAPGATVVDAACGTGYGSNVLADVAEKVIGLEISDHALSWANKNYAANKTNLEFRKTDLNNGIDLPSSFCDVVISFETLEHITNQQKALSEFRRILKPGGTLIISSPDREVITDKAHTENKFHIHELNKKEFADCVQKYFVLEELYGQMKFEASSWYKRLIKWLAKMDVFGVRSFIRNTPAIRFAVSKSFAQIKYEPMTKTAADSKDNFCIIIAVCKKLNEN